MGKLRAQAIIVTCIDYRLQEEIEDWIDKNFQPDTFDRASIAGASKDLKMLLDQVKIARDLHKIREAVLINHQDCGAYGKEGTYEKHIHDLIHARTKINEAFPKLEIRLYYLHLNGAFEEIP